MNSFFQIIFFQFLLILLYVVYRKINSRNREDLILISIFSVILFSDFQILAVKFEADLILFFIAAFFLISYKNRIKLTRLEIIFTFLVCYFILQSIRGIMYTHNIVAIKWVLFFLIILIFSFVIFKNHTHFNVINAIDTIEKTAIFSLSIFLAFTIFESLFAVKISIGRTYLFLPLTFITYLNFYQIKNNSSLRSKLLLIISVIAIILSSSRGAFVPLIFVLILYALRLKIKEKVIYFISFAFLFVIFVILGFSEDIFALFGDSMSVVTDFFSKDDVLEVRDLDRLLHLMTSVETITTDYFHFFFGHGFRTEGILFADTIYDYYTQYLPNLDFVQELNNQKNVDSFGIPAFISNYGVFGCALFLGYIIMLLRKLYLKGDILFNILSYTIILFSITRLYGNNFLGDYFFYFLIMPNGFVFLLRDYVVLTSKAQND